MKVRFSLAAALLALAAFASAQVAGDVKKTAEDTGHETKKVTKKAVHGTKQAAHKTGEATEDAAKKT